MKRSAKKAARREALSYTQMFKTITDIIHEDYAGAPFLPASLNESFYEDAIYQKPSTLSYDDWFIKIVNQYLTECKNRQLRLMVREPCPAKTGMRGFYVRRYEENLYVTETGAESKVLIGDQITHLDGRPILQVKEEMSRYLGSDIAERELWSGILMLSNTCTKLSHNGKEETIILNTYPQPAYDYYSNSFSWIKPDVALLTLKNFLEESSVQELISRRKKKLYITPKIIIDLRKHIGGTDTAFFPLLPYLIDKETSLRKTVGDPGLFTYYTDRNINNRQNDLRLHMSSANEEEKKLLTDMTKEWEKKRGKGVVKEKDTDLKNFDEILNPLEGVGKIVVITDTYCENAGEQLAAIAKKSKKVTVIGRPTMGSSDYCNLTAQNLNQHFSLIYPMSRLATVDKGKGLSGKGVTPDIYIPFTPLELKKDVLLDKALQL